MRILVFFIAASLMAGLPACHKKELTAAPGMDTTQTYFSVRQYVQDQAAFYRGQPYVLTRIETENGRRDSSLVPLDQMAWGPVYKAFLSADISNPKFLGHYKFSQFQENVTGNYILSYEALEPDLHTRTLQLTVDPTNNRILNLYITTGGQGAAQKLLYIPFKIIQIQEDKGSWSGKSSSYRLEYKFPE